MSDMVSGTHGVVTACASGGSCFSFTLLSFVTHTLPYVQWSAATIGVVSGLISLVAWYKHFRKK